MADHSEEIQRDSFMFTISVGADLNYAYDFCFGYLMSCLNGRLSCYNCCFETTRKKNLNARDCGACDLPESDQLNVAFIDVGHASMQVCIDGFMKGQLKILVHSYDRSPGGRDFDEALFKYFAVKFKEEYKIDVQMLSANLEAPLNIECLMDEKDVRGYIKRGDFELISVPILERVKVPLENALQEAHLIVDNIHSVEVVGSRGSGSRVPAIIKILTEYFGKEPRRTLNVHESFSFSIAMSWKGPSNDSENGTLDHQHSAIVFLKGNLIPSVKTVTFYRYSTFFVDVVYANIIDPCIPSKISTYTVFKC
ncbi:Heat shock 70 kDa protein 14 [Platanthera guangdongensis]|uniref:Heat shock 70 kDa protein 14 n=1 Tax=Platanthera guangdongensis TaxID=2320717 RepID=A0ABR2LJE6_9ASPA